MYDRWTQSHLPIEYHSYGSNQQGGLVRRGFCPSYGGDFVHLVKITGGWGGGRGGGERLCPSCKKFQRGLCPPCKKHEGDLVHLCKSEQMGILSKGDFVLHSVYLGPCLLSQCVTYQSAQAVEQKLIRTTYGCDLYNNTNCFAFSADYWMLTIYW